MRDKKGVQALHEPEDTWLDSEELTYFRFLVPMRDKKGVQATHEPLFRSAGCQPAVSPIANRRGVGTANGQRVGNPRYSATLQSRNPSSGRHPACRRAG